MRALRSAGHIVGVCGQASIIDGASGFDAYFPRGSSGPTSTSESTGSLAHPDLEHEFSVIGTYFAGTLAARRFGDVQQSIDHWAPDLLLCDEMDFGAMIAAEQAEIPRVVVNVIASGALTRIKHIRQPVALLRAVHGLGDDPGCTELTRDLVVSPFPQSFRHPDFPLPRTAVSIRPESERDTRPFSAVDWLAAGREPGRVYLTLGTIFNTESGDLFIRVLEGLRKLPVRVLATVGVNIDPASIPVIADNVRIERFVPQSAVLPHCDLVVNHAGSGSVIGALAHGIPVIALPMGADQELNAERLTALSAGITLDPLTVTSAEVHGSALRTLASDSLRTGAKRVRDEIEKMPSPASIVADLELLMGNVSRR
ncbi:glycosyltransferase [Rhodococcus opacus]|uniref:glycosyltransferase n=1 Tax=Rhodococcus opacus TaxID=37919 RepID=UPI002236ACA9|nr:glycosyltransferase [Rhodococcus opacus]MDI9938597.1 glycosyltransferase [Rhodococcus sp. IEGM 1351]MDJ0417547.1 glycosyltransferase [Rhodococcus opacus]UZG58928.1 glycosyltransferase [Rhodococcus opacus]